MLVQIVCILIYVLDQILGTDTPRFSDPDRWDFSSLHQTIRHRAADLQYFSHLFCIEECVDSQDIILKFLFLVHFDLLFNLFGLVDILFTDLNVGSFLHQIGEEYVLFLDPNLEFILMVRDLNQGNPSIILGMDLCLRTGLRAAFPSSCRVQPCATSSAQHG
jgi:hypothetical protein